MAEKDPGKKNGSVVSTRVRAPERKIFAGSYKLLLYTRLIQEETFIWRPGLGFSRLVKAMVRRF